MKSYIILKEYFTLLAQCYDWSLAHNSDNKRLFPHVNRNNTSRMNSTFRHFDQIVIDEKETLYGQYQNGQKVLIAVTPFIIGKIKRLRISKEKPK